MEIAAIRPQGEQVVFERVNVRPGDMRVSRKHIDHIFPLGGEGQVQRHLARVIAFRAVFLFVVVILLRPRENAKLRFDRFQNIAVFQREFMALVHMEHTRRRRDLFGHFRRSPLRNEKMRGER